MYCRFASLPNMPTKLVHNELDYIRYIGYTQVRVAPLNWMHWACIGYAVGMHGMHGGWHMDATINKGWRELQHCGCKRDAVMMQFFTLGCRGCKEDTQKLPKDVGDAKWMLQACRHFHTGCKACIGDARQTASFSFHPAVSWALWICWWLKMDDFRHWMQGMPEWCIIAFSAWNIPAIWLAYI